VPELRFRLLLAVRLGCAPRELGERLTADEFNHLLALWASGAMQGPYL
jgi:hypothetical protein